MPFQPPPLSSEEKPKFVPPPPTEDAPQGTKLEEAISPTGGPENFWTSPHGLIRTGLRAIAQGGRELFTPGQRQRGAADVIEGAGRALAPAAIPFAVANPVSAITAAGLGFGAQKAGEAVAQHFNASPDTQRLAGDVAGLTAGPLATKGVGLLARPAADSLAESALGIRGTTHAYGATPGRAILTETRGIRPGTVEESARGKLVDLNKQLEGKAANAPNPISLKPARQVLAGKSATAAAGNSTATPAEISPMTRQLTEPQPGFTGKTEYPQGAHTPINFITGSEGDLLGLTRGPAPPLTVSEEQPAPAFLNMKRQFDRDFIGNWNPAANTKGQLGIARQAYGKMASEFNQNVPGAAPLNQRISSLVPVAERARLTDLSAGPGARFADRFTRPTGGLVAPLAAFAKGGPLGAAGMITSQEMAASPTVKMLMARRLFDMPRFRGYAPGSILPLGLRSQTE